MARKFNGFNTDSAYVTITGERNDTQIVVGDTFAFGNGAGRNTTAGYTGVVMPANGVLVRTSIAYTYSNTGIFNIYHNGTTIGTSAPFQGRLNLTSLGPPRSSLAIDINYPFSQGDTLNYICTTSTATLGTNDLSRFILTMVVRFDFSNNF